MSLPESSTLHKSSVEATLDEEEEEEVQGGGSEEQVELDETGEVDGTTGGSASKKRKEKVELAREPGKSLLPASRVLKIIKADEDMCLVQKEAQLLISLATEQFMKTFAQAMLATAERERRSTIAVRDIGIIGRSSDRFLFLQELLPDLMMERPAAPKRASKQSKKGDPEPSTATLEGFMNKSAVHTSDVVENEDGTMQTGE